MTPLRLDAPAKLNLWLHVVGRRPNGYHELISEMVLLELADRLLIMPGCSGLRVEAAFDEDVPRSPSANLAWRGLVAGLGEEPQLACLALEKRIPTAAGLGGGSSDAAAAWRLGRCWRGDPQDVTPDEETLRRLAEIGADVPFFAAAVPAAAVAGIGEAVTPRPHPPGGDDVVLAHPPFSLSTAAVYAELRPSDWSAADAEGNDLMRPARRLRPELDRIADELAATGLRPQLTGSGPTLFARTDDAERADAAAARLVSNGVRATRTRLRREPATIEPVNDEEGG
ncbi:MAG TPA: 4-(cytidine 5'-diphospho)-2-C-methyl-D-erythritol kinase [Candidatus Limnocylindria bacterium]|nr:4-(cytidine 5'-diphospho)-2-C-methyl-D-erythritol kinase [Candidatus Limnocylindria bacterium]